MSTYGYDLMKFLRARLDEDERRAQRGYYSDTHWRLFTTTARLKAWVAWRGHYPREQWDVKANDVIADASRDGIRERIDAHEVDRAARMLREVEAKRQIVDAYAEALRIQNSPRETTGELMRRAALEMACLAYAVAYTDQPDYREEWRP